MPSPSRPRRMGVGSFASDATLRWRHRAVAVGIDKIEPRARVVPSTGVRQTHDRSSQRG